MGPNKWEIYNSILCYRDDDGNIIIPKAAEIYSAVFGDSPNTKMWKVEIREQLPDLRFSKISCCISARFCLSNNNICFELYAERRGSKFVLSTRPDFPDHYIIANTWVFLSNVSDDLLRVLKILGPTSSREISLGQYLHLLMEFQKNEIVPLTDEAAISLKRREITNKQLPVGLKATLYPYQEDGFYWIKYMLSEKCGCILADEMGLGKTLQIIALITDMLHTESNHFLIVAPVTLLENWKREFAKFSPNTKVLIHHGPNRTGRYTDLLGSNVVIISYNTAVTDLAMLNMIHWRLVVLDEAQNIKNPETNRTKAVKRLNRENGIAVTGTPFENHLTDVWSLVDYISPGFLGSLSDFSSSFTDDNESAALVEPLLSPLMIRRRVSEVAKDLPERIEIPEILRMEAYESLGYENERQKILAELGDKNAALATLQKLRMFCTHPFLLMEGHLSGDPAKYSLKYNRCCEILEEIISRGEKTILFTSFSGMFDIFLNDIPGRFNIPVFMINGDTPVDVRQPIVDKFSTYSGPALLVLNPRAAGTGLNITAANHVIHYNLEWNPALEDQASARAYRRGQRQTVFIYRLFYTDSVEQIVNERIESKRDISDLAIVGTNGKYENRSDILAALMLSPKEGNI